MTGFKHKQETMKFYLKVKKIICYFSVFFAPLRYFANHETSIAPACLAGGSREQVIFLMTEHLREIRK